MNILRTTRPGFPGLFWFTSNLKNVIIIGVNATHLPPRHPWVYDAVMYKNIETAEKCGVLWVR